MPPITAGARSMGAEGQSGEAVKGAGAGEREAEEAGGRPVAGEGDFEGRSGGKLLSPERRREAVRHAIGRYGVSQRLACRILGQPRGAQRYCPIKRSDDDALTERIVFLACQYGRYGYRRITAMLKLGGFAVGKGRVSRIWRREGLTVPAKHRPRARLWLNDGSCVRLRPE